MVKKRLCLTESLRIDEKWFVRMAQIRHILEVMILTLLALHGFARMIVAFLAESLNDKNIMFVTASLFGIYTAWLEIGLAMFVVFVILVVLLKWAKQKSPFQITIGSFAFIVLKLPVVLFAFVGSPKWLFISCLIFGGLRVLLWGWKFWCHKKDGETKLFYFPEESVSSSSHDLQVK